MSIFSPAEEAAHVAALLLALSAAVVPPPELKISEWAEGRIELPGETGTARTGKLSWDGFEYLIEPLDRLHQDDPCRDVVFVGSAQIAKTTIGVIATQYYSAEVPRPWAVALPSTDEVLKYNRSKWQPIVDATPELKRKVRPVSSRDEQGSTNTYKRFSGGYGQFFAVGSPKALQMMTLCITVYEETPNWEREVGGRGDPRSQIRKRQLQWERAGAKTFHNSTPGTKRQREDGETGTVGCPVTEDFEASDQRRLYLPCPHCADLDDGALIRLDYERMEGLEAGEVPHFACPACGGVIEHRHKADMVARCRPYQGFNGRRGGWLPVFESADPENPAPDWWVRAADYETWRERNCEGRAPGYHAWQVISAAVDWDYIAAEHRKAMKGSEAEKIAFSQQILGEAYEIVLQQADVDQLLEKRDNRLRKGVVPAGYEILTCAVDLNGDWAQWTTYAYGPGGEHTPIDKGRIDGSPSDAELWAGIAELETRTWPHEEGGRLGLSVLGVDSGYGTFNVYAYCSRHAHSKALDGAKGWGLMPLRRAPVQKLQGPDGTVVRCRTWRVGTWDLKRQLLNEAIPASLEGENSTRAAGKPHWPGWVEKDFFEELTAEALLEVQEKKTGIVKDEAWVRVRRRNEEMDLWVYNMALARSLGVGVPGAEPDWIDLARRRQVGQLGLEELWDRPSPPSATQAAQPASEPAAPKSKWSF